MEKDGDNNLEIGITGLEPFMNKNFFDLFFYDLPSDIRIKEYSLITKNKVPYLLVVIFSNEQSKQKFISDYNRKNYPNLNMPIVVVEKISDADRQASNDLPEDKIINFSIDYTKLVSLNYERTQKEGGLVYKDKKIIEDQDKVISYLMKKFTKNFFNGESIMNISLPVSIFDHRSLLQVFAYQQGFADIFLNRAFYSSGLERLKWVSVFLFSQMHIAALQTKPFNPILGETYQAKINDLDLYLEHVLHKPPTYRFYGVSKLYTISGHQSVQAHTGANSAKAFMVGDYKITFVDGQVFELFPPCLIIKGVTVGKRIFYFRRTATVIDKVSPN